MLIRPMDFPVSIDPSLWKTLRGFSRFSYFSIYMYKLLFNIFNLSSFGTAIQKFLIQAFFLKIFGTC